MIEGDLNPSARRDVFGSKINRTHSPILAIAIPWASVLLASLSPFLPFFPGFPLVPPIALLMLLGWRFVRPGLMPSWAGLPLGAFDDLFSGQPFGSAIMLWSLAMLALDAVEARFPWRGFWQDWLAAIAVLTVYIFAAALFSGAHADPSVIPWLLPQLLLSIMLFPIVARIVARLDRLRLRRIRRIG